MRKMKPCTGALFFVVLALWAGVAFCADEYYLQVRHSEDTAYGKWNAWDAYSIPADKVEQVLALAGMTKKQVTDSKDNGKRLWENERANPPAVREITADEYLADYNAQIEAAQASLDKYLEKATPEQKAAVDVGLVKTGDKLKTTTEKANK